MGHGFNSKLLVITQGYGCYGWARAWLVGFDVQFWLGDSWKTLENLWKMMELIGKIYWKRMNTVEIIGRITKNGGTKWWKLHLCGTFGNHRHSLWTVGNCFGTLEKTQRTHIWKAMGHAWHMKKHYDNMDVERVWTQSAEWSYGNHGNTFGQRGSNQVTG